MKILKIYLMQTSIVEEIEINSMNRRIETLAMSLFIVFNTNNNSIEHDNILHLNVNSFLRSS